jgi:CheY-like chemotaxis protein/HPt (histidine-containing phosphotransfer) domain-containing protein
MINRKRLLAISELNLVGKIEKMEDDKLATYVQLINLFVDGLPEQKKKIKDALTEKDYKVLRKHLLQVRDRLAKIFAEDMAQDCAKHIGWLDSEKHEKIEAYVNYLLSLLTILAADIQEAQQQTDGSPNTAQDDAEAEAEAEARRIFVEKLFGISELKLAGKIERMREDEIDNYLHLLNMFTEDFPAQEEQIKEALKTGDNDAFVKQLADIRDILGKMYAEEMAQDCTKQINSIGLTSPEKIEAYMEEFLSRLSMLSIDIQMAGIRSATAPIPEGGVEDKYSAGIRILAVDDTPFFLTILKKILSDSTYILTCVSTGKDALKYLEKYQPDIFLLDIEMPGMDGYELAEKIKETGQDAPIIFLTGNAQKEYLAKALKLGAADFIIKPINKEILISKIHKYLR